MLAHSVLLVSPFADLTAHYYHLKARNSSLEILESYIYEVRDNLPYRNAKVVALLWHPCDKVVAIKLSLGCHYLATTL